MLLLLLVVVLVRKRVGRRRVRAKMNGLMRRVVWRGRRERERVVTTLRGSEGYIDAAATDAVDLAARAWALVLSLKIVLLRLLLFLMVWYQLCKLSVR
jgi:hypothetical protein